MSLRLRVAEWLAWRFPFDWAPVWLNRALARWMWRTPGFDVDRSEFRGGA